MTEESVYNDHKKSADINSRIASTQKEIQQWQTMKQKMDELTEMVEMTESDGDEKMLAELEKEHEKLKTELDALEIELLFTGENDAGNAFVNIHPGAGGTESQDWAEMLLRLYQRWGELHGFTVDVINYEPGEGAGIKDAILYIQGHYAFGYLSAENGIHRLVRLSPFNANNKRQTSFCAVSVSPEVSDDINIEINEKDIRIDTYRASGAGGQHVNKTSSAIRITHFPTGIVVTCQNERSQFQNKDMAMMVLKSRIYEYEKERMNQQKAEKSLERKSIEWGNQIRSYTFQPYTLVKDHRTGVEKGNIQAVMDGEIDEFILGYLKSKAGRGQAEPENK